MKIHKYISESIAIKQLILADTPLLDQIEFTIQSILKALNTNSKILWCGNGGSAADAQHLSAELSGRFYLDRKALNSEALHVNTSYLTAVANDYGYENIFSRALEAKGQAGDVLIALTTSGNSKNILNAIKQADKLGMTSILLTGQDGSSMSQLCAQTLKVPSTDTPRIQECHMLIGHIICAEVEARYFK